MSDELPYFHPAQGTRPRRGRGWIIGMVAGVLAVILTGVIGARAVLVRALCEQSPIRLHVAVSPDIAPAVMSIGQRFNNLNRDVGGHCAQVEVTEDQASAVAAVLSGTSSTALRDGQPDAWVPDSSLWPDVVRNSPRGAAAVRWTGVSVATSPLVIAAPQKVAGTLANWSRHVSWHALLPNSLGGPPPTLGLQIQLPDPTTSAAGLATLVQMRRMFSGRQTARAQFTDFAHNVQPTTAFQDAQSLANFTASSQPPWNGNPVTVTSEQAVGSYNQSNPRVPLTALYPAQDFDLDYPFVVTASATLKLQAAQQFEQVLRSSFAATRVRAAGFRSPAAAGQPSNQPGNSANPQQAVQLAAPGEASTALQAWRRLGLGSRQLVLDDVSGVMTQPLQPGSDSRIRVIQDAAAVGLALAPDSTQMAVWEYSYRMAGSLPYRVIVPMGPLPEELGLITRRQQLQQMTQTVTARPGTPAAFYSTILAAFQWMTTTYQPGHVNAIVVLGSGVENAPGDLSLSETLTRLRATWDPRRPVEIIIISAGTEGNQGALEQIAEISHGQAYVVQQPSDMLRVFYDAVGRRICTPNC